ncbi:hypothetical protein [Methanopyrus sp.]
MGACSPYRVYNLPKALERFYEPRWGKSTRRNDRWYFGTLELNPLTEDDIELREITLMVSVAEANLISSHKFRNRKRDAAYASYLVGASSADVDDVIPVTVRIPWPRDVKAPREMPLVPGTLTNHRRFCFTVPNPPETKRFSEKTLVTAALLRTLSYKLDLTSTIRY